MINPITIKLPNGALVTTSYVGIIHFDHYMYLSDVTYMPGFSFNLIFVPKLTRISQCQLILNDNDCMIHDIHSKNSIGTTRSSGRLYILESPSVTLHHTPSNHSINTLHNKSLDIDQNCNLWHLRLGHPSNTKLISITQILSFYTGCL